jgi:hypothetical protein
MKLAFVGGGSYSWGPALLGDLEIPETYGINRENARKPTALGVG